MPIIDKDAAYIQERTGYATAAMKAMDIPTANQRTILAQEISLALLAERRRCLAIIDHYETAYSHLETGHLFAKLRSGIAQDGKWPVDVSFK